MPLVAMGCSVRRELAPRRGTSEYPRRRCRSIYIGRPPQKFLFSAVRVSGKKTIFICSDLIDLIDLTDFLND